jgi:ABC-type antimicrobial peptide transport system permease subunit
MQQWLQHFTFRIELSWWIFLIGGVASVIIALISVSFQAIKAAIANPIKSLRTE